MTAFWQPGRIAVTAATVIAAAACGTTGAHRPSVAVSPAASPTASPTTSAASCSPSKGATPPGLPDPQGIDHSDATAVARAAVTVMWTVDAEIDQGQRDAYKRACPYLTAQYAAQIASEDSVGPVPAVWKEHRAYAKVSLTLQQPEGDLDPDTATRAYRQWSITVTPTGRDGWTGPRTRATAFVVLVRATARDSWRVFRVTTA